MVGKPAEPIQPCPTVLVPHALFPVSTAAAPKKPRPCPISCNTTDAKSTWLAGVLPSVPKYQVKMLLKLARISGIAPLRSLLASALANAAGYHVFATGALGKSR